MIEQHESSDSEDNASADVDVTSVGVGGSHHRRKKEKAKANVSAVNATNGDYTNQHANADANNDEKSTVDANANADSNANVYSAFSSFEKTMDGAIADLSNDKSGCPPSGNAVDDSGSSGNPFHPNGCPGPFRGSFCYCCYDEKITTFNIENGFVKNSNGRRAEFSESSSAFPGYLPLVQVRTDMKDKIARSRLISEITQHSDFVYEVAEYFQFLTAETRTILSTQCLNFATRAAFAERFAILILLVKRYTSSINTLERKPLVLETTTFDGVVQKGISHLQSFVKRIHDSPIPKWSDYYGSFSKDKMTKRRFGPFILIRYKLKNNEMEQRASDLYSLLGSAENYGGHNYKKYKKEFLDGEMLEERQEPFQLLNPNIAKEYVEKVAEAMLSGFEGATEGFTRDTELSEKFCNVHNEMKQNMFRCVQDSLDNGEFSNDLPNECRAEFLKEAGLFLGKFAWMVLQHIRCFPKMQGSDDYIKQQIGDVSTESGECNKKRKNDNKSCELAQEVQNFFDCFWMYDEIAHLWSFTEGRLPTQPEGEKHYYLSIGDVIEVTIGNNTWRSRISNFVRGICKEGIPIELQLCEDHIEQSDITFVPGLSDESPPLLKINRESLSSMQRHEISSRMDIYTEVRLIKSTDVDIASDQTRQPIKNFIFIQSRRNVE
jgi:hypothetical protein